MLVKHKGSLELFCYFPFFKDLFVIFQFRVSFIMYYIKEPYVNDMITPIFVASSSRTKAMAEFAC